MLQIILELQTSLSLGCVLHQPEAEVEKLQPKLRGAAELQAMLQPPRCKNYPAHQGIPLPPFWVRV